MKKIMFICHGNICRSPMAEFIFKDIVKKHHLESDYYISSAATSLEEIGNDIYPKSKEVLRKNNISFERRMARRITYFEYSEYDYFIVMDDNNIKNLQYIFTNINQKNKIYKLKSFTGSNKDVLDPWYTDRFDECYKDIYDGCVALFNYLETKKSEHS